MASMLSLAGFQLPIELVREARVRVRRLAIACFPLAIIIGIGWLVAGLTRVVDWSTAWILPAGTGLMIVASLALLAACKSKRVGDATVIYLALIYEILLCGLGGFAHAAHEYHRFQLITPFGPYALMIALAPLVVPCPPLIVLTTSLLSATAVLAGVAIAELAGLAEATLGTYFDVGSIAFGCAAIAAVASRLLYRLHTDVANAKRLGSYELQHLLGSGGMGEVWSARHRLLARPAAIKLIRPETLSGHSDFNAQEVLARFTREAKATAALESPHTIRLFDFGVTDDGALYYAMELLDGIDLDTLVATRGPLPPERVVRVLLQLCDSIAEAHDVGLLHRDIKPANVMLCRVGRTYDFVKVLDFGLVIEHFESPADSGGRRLTTIGSVVGTPGFMAPEVLMGIGSDKRSDIYSIGCLAYWLLTARPVFERNSAGAVGIAHVREPVPAPSSIGFRVPSDLESIVLACLAKTPEERPQSIDEITARLSSCTSPEPWDHQRAREWWSSEAPRRARSVSLSTDE